MTPMAACAHVVGAALLAGCATRRPRRRGPGRTRIPSQAASPANIASLTEVVQRNPNDAQAYNVRGSVLGRAGRNQEALADFDRAIALDANYAQAYANRGQVHRQMNRLEPALADYNKALSLDQNYAAAYLGRGQVYRAQGRALDALNDYNRAIQMAPDQRAGLLQPRPALSGAGAAQVRGRRFLHRDRADPAAGRAATSRAA